LSLISNEQELFDWLKDNVYPDLLVAKNPMSRWDCYSPNTRHRIELKCRDKHYPDLLVEKKKYDAVVRKCNDNLDVPVYINSTPKGVFRFNMLHHDGFWEVRGMPKTTQFANNNFIAKEVGYFNVDQADILL